MDTSKERRWLELGDEIDQLDERLKELKAERDALAAQITDDWACNAVSSVTVGGKLVYLNNEMHAATPQGMDAVVLLLKGDKQHGAIVRETVNKQTLDALVRELTRNEDGSNGYDRELPARFAGVIGKFPQTKLRARKAAGSKQTGGETATDEAEQQEAA